MATRIDDAPTSTNFLGAPLRASSTLPPPLSLNAKFLAPRELDACAVRKTQTHAGGMLERATACLKARAARDSLQCAQQHARRASKRLLHHTFWTHGAGDLDLPPYIASSTPPAGLPLRHDDPPSAPKNSRSAAPTPSTTDGVFLDFLYPPQALAYLHRANRQSFESWEYRNARRLPEGFVRASRHYSSTARSKRRDKTTTTDPEKRPETSAQQATPDDEEDEVRTSDPFAEAAGEQTDSARIPRYQADQATELAKELGVGKRADTRTGVQQALEGAVESRANDFADTAGELDDMQSRNVAERSRARENAVVVGQSTLVDSTHAPDQRLRQLRFIMAMKREHVTQVLIRQAWQLYLSLHEDDKRDLRLKEKLLVWLNEREDELADAYITALFWSIPLHSRTLPIYQTVAQSFLRGTRANSLLSVLHKEALTNIPNGQQLTLQLFTHALKTENFYALRRAVKEHDRVFMSAGQSMSVELFWVKVAEIPDLMTSVLPLAKRSDGANRSEIRNLRVKLSKEAVQQATDGLFHEQPSIVRTQEIFALLNVINKYDSHARRFFHTLLVRLLPALGQQRVEKHGDGSSISVRENAHQIISYLYWHSRQGEDTKVHPDLMLIWLKHLTSRMDTTNKEYRSERNATASMVIEDWQAWYEQLSADAVHNLISYSARAGAVDALSQWTAYLNRRYPSYQEQQKAFWAQIYVHAQLSDLAAAKQAFKDVSRSARAHGARVDLKCWNVLLYAHQQADDLEGAMETFKEMLQRTKFVPDAASFAPLVNMLARRGDVDAVEDILQQYDLLTQEKRPTKFVRAHIMALNLIDDPSQAELLLQESLVKVRQGQIIGSMTDCVNLMLAKYASMRDIDATMHIYRVMKQRNIFRNATTYRHLMQSLANFRQTNAAWAILTKGMRRDGFVPTAAHYTVAMAGFINEDQADKAIMAHQHMVKQNIRESLSTKQNLIKAKALIEKKVHNRARNSGQEISPPLANALADLQAMVEDLNPRDITARDRSGAHSHTAQDMFSPVMWALGGEQQVEVVQQLFQDSQATANKYGHSPWPTIRLSAGLMNAFYHAKEFAQVEAYWKVVKEQVDGIAARSPVPDFVALRQIAREKPTSNGVGMTASDGAEMDDRAELGFTTDQKSEAEASRAPMQSVQMSNLGPRPAPARRGVLTRPFRIYLASLAAQNRLEEGIREATRLLSQGYTFDNITWNRFIEYIAGSEPPLALLAFTLVERYLIRKFPGWIGNANRRYPLRKSARALGMQYIRARYLAQNELMPQYRTFIWLAKALLEVRRREAGGWQGKDGEQGINATTKRLIGTTAQIREKAPRTLRAVQMMPRIEDKWQNRLLRGIGWKFPPGADRKPTIGDAQLVHALDDSEPLTDDDLAFLADAGLDTKSSTNENASQQDSSMGKPDDGTADAESTTPETASTTSAVDEMPQVESKT
ncbi:hypothetical protein CB0940_03129 [Cercospora beticola]|uniref:Pentatricopeptide repeat-containing protein n=1 Tax=Cercospora beticola TaxID=122368 RepID=A0A2G5I2U9_CERBT|nr:hypothetical protein CB0940_03129 [Cercospora beticola]PIA99081.1 hypothetical protein CB0940_03129 [Cercospora beticola]WPB00296.1 hypothetical protein RHO25_004915 [Cercospora beticola]CAK1361507.1 unnamed protein product [Cercospora beticola]